MAAYEILAYLFTLIFGGIFAYFFINPLGLLVYILIWIDVIIIPKLVISEVLGFELISLAGILGGIALGAWFGFLLTLFGIPIIVTVLRSIVNFKIDYTLPNFDLLVIALAAAEAGLLKGYIGIVPLVFTAILFKHFIINLLNARGGSEITYLSSALNIAFTVAAIYSLEKMGFLALFLH